jgi:ribose transport system substrate-binding protein
MGYDGVNAAVDALRNDAQLEDIDTGATLVTQENLDDPEVKAVLDPSCENKPEVSE